MGARFIRSSNSRQRNRRERRVLFTILGSTVFPLLLAYILVALDMRPDLSEMKARTSSHYLRIETIAWSALALSPDPRSQPRVTHASVAGPCTMVRMMGYMMDGNAPVSNGAMVSRFVLMSEAGQLFHPAHLEPSHMVEVSLQHPVAFEFRRLIWASGFLRGRKSRPRYGESGWKMTNAQVEPASPKAILEWFEP